MTAFDGLLPRPSHTAITPDGGEVEQLRHRIAELIAAVEARDTFIAIAAHELRNPMAPIIGQIELLRSAVRAGRCTLEQVDDRVERIQQSMRHFVTRTDILLDVSRINSGRLRLALESCDIANLLRDIAADFAGAALHAGVTISVTAPDRLLGTWDRLALEQITDNLLSNAIKYGCGTPVEISADRAASASASRFVTMAAASQRLTANGCSGVSNGRWDETSAAPASASACGSSAN